jgi:hypothetical protein
VQIRILVRSSFLYHKEINARLFHEVMGNSEVNDSSDGHVVVCVFAQWLGGGKCLGRLESCVNASLL